MGHRTPMGLRLGLVRRPVARTLARQPFADGQFADVEGVDEELLDLEFLEVGTADLEAA